ncbi:MAG TPA: hypothetical protein VLL77_06450 [Anaerolineales bacterium]|nr:hypothetical protein [Anaerolineales bacterium]
MASEAMGAPESTSDDRLWSALAYVFTPLVPIIILLWEEKKNRPYIRAHNMQALVMGIVEVALWFVLSFTIVGLCIPFLLWVVMLYWAYQAYSGKMVRIPVVTDLVKNQGWA